MTVKKIVIKKYFLSNENNFVSNFNCFDKKKVKFIEKSSKKKLKSIKNIEKS